MRVCLIIIGFLVGVLFQDAFSINAALRRNCHQYLNNLAFAYGGGKIKYDPEDLLTESGPQYWLAEYLNSRSWLETGDLLKITYASGVKRTAFINVDASLITRGHGDYETKTKVYLPATLNAGVQAQMALKPDVSSKDFQHIRFIGNAFDRFRDHFFRDGERGAFFLEEQPPKVRLLSGKPSSEAELDRKPLKIRSKTYGLVKSIRIDDRIVRFRGETAVEFKLTIKWPNGLLEEVSARVSNEMITEKDHGVAAEYPNAKLELFLKTAEGVQTWISVMDIKKLDQLLLYGNIPLLQ